MLHVIRQSGTMFLTLVVFAIACQTGCNSSDGGKSSGVATNVTSTGGDTKATPAADNANSISSASPATSPSPASSSSAAPAVGTVFKEGDVSVTLIDAPAFQAAIQQHKGKVVLVDCWATWCEACMEEFPKTVELSRKLKDKGLDVVSVSFDLHQRSPAALEFLKKQGATFQNLVIQNGQSLEAFVGLDIVGGALPFYKLYDRSGKLRYQFAGNVEGLEGVLKVSEIGQRVEELLAENVGG